MFRLLMICIVIGFIGLLVFSIIKLINGMVIKPTENKVTTYEEIEDLISKIKLKILRAELDQLSGIEGAEKDLEYWNNQLRQTNELKEKTRNL